MLTFRWDLDCQDRRDSHYAGECFRSLPADRRSVYARRAAQSFPTDHSLFTPARGTRWAPVPSQLPFIARIIGRRVMASDREGNAAPRT